MKKIQSLGMACFATMCIGLASCTDETFVEEVLPEVKTTGQPFTLTANQSTPSRLALGEDGLTVKWESGDQLVLVKKDRTLTPIYLSTDLKEASVSATFVAETGVPAGDYWVIYNYNEDLVYTHQPFMSITEINDNNKLVLWGELTVKEGESSASITLQHIYAKVRVVLKNAPTSGSYTVGMYASKTGFPIYKQFTPNGLVNVAYGPIATSSDYIYHTSDRKRHNICLGHMSCVDDGSGAATPENMGQYFSLILPEDVSDGTLYFMYVELAVRASVMKFPRTM